MRVHALALCASLSLTLLACSSSEDPEEGVVTDRVGEPAPAWAAEDFQPKSARFGESYGLEAYRGKVVFVAFLSAWCPYCHAQVDKLQQMRDEFAAEGAGEDVQIVVVNSIDAETDKAQFVVRTEVPLFQDDGEAQVFRKHKAAKDDFALYDREGKLLRFYPASHSRDLRESEAYTVIKGHILDAR